MSTACGRRRVSAWNWPGPAGVEFGVVDPGGGVNFVTKKPLPDFAATAEVEVGSFQQRAVKADITGPITPGLSFRLIGHAGEAESFRDTLDSEQLTVAPSLLYQYGDGNALLLEASYQKQDLPYDRGTFYLEGAGFEDDIAPIDRSLHEPDDSLDSEVLRLAAYWTQALVPGLLFNAAIDYTEDSFLSLGARNPNLNGLYIPGTVRWNGTNRTVQRSFVRFEADRHGWTGQVDLTGSAEFGMVDLRGQVGYTHSEYEDDLMGRDNQTRWVIDAFNPVYGTAPVVIGTPQTVGRDFRSDTTITETGLFAQATAVVADDLRLLAGVRRDKFDEQNIYIDNVNIPARAVPDITGLEDEKTFWRIGASYAVLDDVSVFAGYSVAYQPQSGGDRAGNSFEALKASSWEAGVKAEALGGIATGSFSVFTITQENLAEPDPDNLPGQSFQILVGEVEARGAELEGALALTDTLTLGLGVSYLDTEITRNLRGQQGNRLYNTPEWQFSGRAAYDWAGMVDGLRTWVGLVHVDERYGDNSNRFTLPAYTRVDAGLSYAFDRYTARVTVENLFDERYFLGAQNRPQNVAPGAPRNFTAAIGVRF